MIKNFIIIIILCNFVKNIFMSDCTYNGTLTLWLHDARIQYHIANDEVCYNKHGEYNLNSHYKLFDKINAYLKRRCFKVTADPDTLKNYKSISLSNRFTP